MHLYPGVQTSDGGIVVFEKHPLPSKRPPGCNVYGWVMKERYRPDREGPRRSEFEKNKKKILLSQSICGICGKPVDKTLKYPHPQSATVDHIIPVDKGGDPSALSNLQLAHMKCNRQKSDKIILDKPNLTQKVVNNRDLPLSMDWTKYKAQA